MAEQIKIAELSIDNKKLLSEIESTKKSLDDLNKTQKELKKAGDTNSKTFIENEAKLKTLRKEYNSQIKVLAATSGANEKYNQELNKEIKSIDEAKKNNAELVQLRNQMNASTKEGATAIAEINKKIDENNAKINAGSSSLEKQFQNIGNYPDGLDKISGGLGGVASGFLSAAKASLKFIATPIGALLAALAGAFALVRTAMSRSEESTNRIRKAFSAFQGITNSLFKVLEPLGEFLIDGLVKGFELVEKGIYKALDAIASGLEFLGFDEQASSLRSFNQEVQQSAADAKALSEAEAQLAQQQRESQKIQLEYQKQAEQLRQIRDDENRTIAERVAANEELGNVLKQQLTDELSIAEAALAVANARIQAEGASSQLLDAQAEALTTIADIQERITGQESEQLVNRVALQKEAADKAKEIADEAIARQEAELELFIQQQGIRAKTLEEQLAVAKQVSDKEIAILDAQLKNRNITQTEYDAQYLQIKNDLAQKNAELAVDNAQRELDAYLQNNQTKLEDDIFFSQEALRIEQERLDGIAQARRDFEATRLAEGVITQQEYNDAINAINDENRIAQEEAEQTREEAEAEKQIIDFENRMATLQENQLAQFAQEEEYLAQQKALELANAEATGADKAIIEEKYASYSKDLERAKTEAKLELAQGALGNIATIFGKESKIGKAAAIADTTINTYKAATAAYSSLAGIPIVGPVLGALAAAAAVAAGIANVKKIVSTKPKFAEGGILQGASHLNGGIKTPYGELEGGEAVINKKSTAMYAPLLSQINEAGGGRKFATGGILGATNIPKQTVDYDLLAVKVAEANQSLPAPRVAVDEISTVTNRVSVIEQQATF